MSSFSKSEFWKDFFKMYKSLPETWKITSEEYKNKNLKKRAYQQLLDKLKEIEPEATIDTLKKKINNFRTSYRRELKKIKKSENSGCSAINIYVPCLWYFDDLYFLKDQLGFVEGVSDDSETSSLVNTSKSTQVESKKRLRGKGKPRQRLHSKINEADEADTLCASWVMRYRKLDPQQQLYANKTIEEVLYQAALGNLNEYSYKSVETYPVHRTYSSSNAESPPTTMFINSASPPSTDDKSQITSHYCSPKSLSSSGSAKPVLVQVHPDIRRHSTNTSTANCSTINSDQFNNRHQNFNL